MNPLLEAFLAESREALERIGSILLRMENSPDDSALMEELFRLVHTLKGSSGFFDLPELTRVLHAGEDLMSSLREGAIAFDRAIADLLLETMDFVAILCDEIETTGGIASTHTGLSLDLAARLRSRTGDSVEGDGAIAVRPDASESVSPFDDAGEIHPPDGVPDPILEAARQLALEGTALHWVRYVPAPDCFFHGEDPLHLARQVPGLLHGRVVARKPWPPLVEFDLYRCAVEFQILAAASAADLSEHFRYVPEQVRWTPFDPIEASPAEVSPAPRANPYWREPELPPEERSALSAILAVQRQVIESNAHPKGRAGRLRAAASVLERCATAVGDPSATARIGRALDLALADESGNPLLDLLEEWVGIGNPASTERIPSPSDAMTDSVMFAGIALPPPVRPPASDLLGAFPQDSEFPEGRPDPADRRSAPGREEGMKFGRRADDHLASKTLKVDQEKIDRLMNLIGEMVVAKNALPYLAQRAEEHFGIRELSREIKSQYASINRIAEEMQDAIMQVRMMPISVVFQRFPRLVRDVSRKLGKEVDLVLEGEETEADKSIVESLADPLIHMVRNSLDHGFETPEVRRARGKPPSGRLAMRAFQEGDRVLIEVQDDGKGIDPSVVKAKAYEKGLIDEAGLERISDRDALHLVFAPGFSTADQVSDLSGRGVGMDVVRTAVEKVHGTISLESEVGKGTLVRISLPLSMAVTKLMVVESDGQIFGIPMDLVSETVRVPRDSIHTVQHGQATILRGRVLPLKPLNTLLHLGNPPVANAEDMLAVLVVRLERGTLGLIVDDFRATLDVIQKPLGSVLAGLGVYSGSALLGDGKVLMVLNLKEMV